MDSIDATNKAPALLLRFNPFLQKKRISFDPVSSFNFWLCVMLDKLYLQSVLQSSEELVNKLKVLLIIKIEEDMIVRIFYPFFVNVHLSHLWFEQSGFHFKHCLYNACLLSLFLEEYAWIRHI